MTLAAKAMRAALPALIFLVLALPSEAQLAKILRQTNLTPEDMALANGAAQTLFEKPGLRTGQVSSWQNSESGASGTVTVLRIEQGGACVTVRHDAQPADKPQRQFTMRRCKDSEGTWMLVP
jgi:hypothetical protein